MGGIIEGEDISALSYGGTSNHKNEHKDSKTVGGGHVVVGRIKGANENVGSLGAPRLGSGFWLALRFVN